MSLRYGARRTLKRRTPRAGLYQARNDPTRLLAESHKPKIAAALSDALKRARRAVPRGEIARLIRAGDLAGAADAVNLASLHHDLKIAFDRIADAFKASGQRGADEVNRLRVRPVRKAPRTFGGHRQVPDRFAFDLLSEPVLDQLQTYQDALIGGLTNDVRSYLFDVIANGVRDALDPDTIATRIRDQIGLSDRLATAVANYRDALENASSIALDRQLRDPSGDDEVRASIAAGEPLSPERIDDLVDAYSDRALDYRADMIAQTESTRAANMGLQESYRQAVSDGVFPDDAVRQFWMVALDEKVCGAVHV